MHIDSYQFGEIIIDGKKYDKDVIILGEEVFSPWWRQEGHLLSRDDLDKALEQKPEILIIGNGAAGLMKVSAEIEDFIKERGIVCLILNTQEACRKFNELKSLGKKVVATLHLTC